MSPKSNWHLLNDEQLLNLRLRDLPLRIEGTALEGRVQRLYDELAAHGLRFRPHVWLSDEWFTPDGVPGFAIPFYLAHPRLMRLERKYMLEVEGGAQHECMRILRHEAGHALNNAFLLHHRQGWRDLFGSFAEPYPDYYRPRPNSRNYVLHLNAWYAQAHPAEDFAETFAVWLTPGSRWRRRYQGWPALQKLEYVDRVLSELAGTPPKIRLRRKVEPLSETRFTLREHYDRKRQYYAVNWPALHDRDLRRIFSQEARHRARPTAASFLRRLRPEVRHLVAEGTGVHHYTVDQLLKNMIDRCRALKLRVGTAEALTRRQVIVMLTVHTMNVVHSGYQPIAL